MKKIILSVALVLCAMAAKAEKLQVINRDTIAWNKHVEAQAIAKSNDFGETRITYKAVLSIVTEEGKTKEKKVSISKATYNELQAGKQAYVVLTTYEDGSEKITKVVTK